LLDGGLTWVHHLVRALAAEGRTVFLSSHLMSEMSRTADQLLVIGRGRIIAAGPVQQVIDFAGGAVRVRSPRAGDAQALAHAEGEPSDALRREVGALLDAKAVHPGRSARSHLRTMAATHKIKASRVSKVIEMTGLAG
jgi:ABC-2 type transport system ATP-binding protein